MAETRSEMLRKSIRSIVKSIKNMVEELGFICEDEFGEPEIPEIRELTEKIADASILIKDRQTHTLSDLIYEEETKN